MRIISFSLFGNNPRYTINALVNADLCTKYYPGWVCKIYYDDTVPECILQNLKSKSNVDLVSASGIEDCRRMWRFYAYDDCDVFISRDIDSHVSEREKAAVEEWLISDKNMHIMRDHEQHKTKILAGMFGIKRNSKLTNLMNRCIEYTSINKPHPCMDENFLNEIYPIFQNDMVVHDDRNRHNDKTHNWTVSIERTDEEGEFVGRPQNPPTANVDLYKKYEIFLAKNN